MAYTPINWQTGDTITAEKLNKMDNGWGYENTQLFSETVTADGDVIYEAELTYSQLITADTITVTFDGTEYECPSIAEGEYGAPFNDNNYDFSEFPFNLYTSSGSAAYLATQTAGTHTIAVGVPSIVVSPDFSNAVRVSVAPDAFEVAEGTTTWQEAHDALVAGKYVYFLAGGSAVSICHVFRADTSDYSISFLYIASSTSSAVTVSHLSADSADGVLVA